MVVTDTESSDAGDYCGRQGRTTQLFRGAHSPSCGRGRVCHPVNQSRIRQGRGTPQEKEIGRASTATVAIRRGC